MQLLNPRTEETSLLQANYDKILHIACSFTTLVWLDKVMSKPVALGIVVSLCILKTVWNYYRDSTYKPLGDWIANLIGFGLWMLY